ncbi:MAG: NADH-quinone oxidoreductase subunit M [Planctomycetes bacterium]|nr:NADH-quinone oxidoreductase subunit M [Planctomycetota bacterium]
MNLLLVTTFLPLLGVLAIWLTAEAGRANARRIALITSLVTLAFAAAVILPEERPLIDVPWFSASNIVDIRFALGLDGLSLWMFGLSALLSVTAILVSWEAIEDRAPAFYALLLLLETGMLGVFAARDVILFYIFFEFTLIPLFFLIGIWGSEDRRYAAVKFFLFTLAGSLLTFLGLLSIVLWDYAHSGSGVMSFYLPGLTQNLAKHPIDPALQCWIFGALFAGFAIKVPLFPLHTWLPLAHVQAPTAGSVILAGILLKIGTYGFLRFNLPLLPEATVAWMPWVLWLSAAGIIYGALVALAQTDIKRLIAYSSVSHLGYCMLGIFALNALSVQGGVLQMINHGLSTGGLFAVVGMTYERYHTRQIAELSGLARRTPILAFFMLLFTFSSIGLPGLNGFAGEFLILAGMFQRGYADAPAIWQCQWTLIAVLAVFGVILGAWYMLWLVQRVFFGPLKEPAHHGDGHHAAHAHEAHSHDDHGHHHEAPLPPGPRDLGLREVLALAPLVALMFWIGLAPQHFLTPMAADLHKTSAPAQAALFKQYGPSVAAAEVRPARDVPAAGAARLAAQAPRGEE